MKYKNLLVIDDDTDDLDFFSNAIKTIGQPFNCMYYNNSTIAYNALSSRTIAPDAIFLDVNMPGMTGQEFLAKIKADPGLSSIPVYILSTSGHTGIIEEMKKLGADDFLVKPAHSSELVTLIKNVVSS
ncbi:MAG: response regulator [Bacteroidota bacterium]